MPSKTNQLHKLIGDYSAFLEDILRQIEAAGFDMTDFSQLDHMCYRTVSEENYKTKQRDLMTIAKLLGETRVNGRLISTFRLHEPVLHGTWRVDAIELPAPKMHSSYEEGLEHIELVLFDDFSTFLKKYQGMPFELRAADRGINPEIGLKLGKYTVKFHLLNLPTVVYLEDKIGLHDIKDGMQF